MMIDEGLLEEIKGLLERGISFDDQCMQGIGYKEFRAYFEGVATPQECIELVKKNTRHFVKRQYTWFNNQMHVNWYEVNLEHFEKTVDDVEKDVDVWIK